MAASLGQMGLPFLEWHWARSPAKRMIRVRSRLYDTAGKA